MYAFGYGATDIGRNRSNNEDAFWLDSERGIFVISDGMGGHAAGEVASQTAVEGIRDEINERNKVIDRFCAGEGDADAIEDLARDLVNAAGRRVYQVAVEHPEYHRMGCTLTLLLQVRDKIVIGHVGDTRAYLFRNGVLHQLTRDHTLAAELADAGAIAKSEVKESRFAHVLTRVLGHQEFVKVDTLCMQVVPGDRFLLCSDGLSGPVNSNGEIIDVVSDADLGNVPARLISFANERGGDDNITAMVVEIGGTSEERVAGTKELALLFGALEADFLFQDFYLSRLAQVMNACRFETFAPGETVIRAGTPCAQLHIVANGRVSIEREGCETGELVAGKVFGGTTLVHPRSCRASVKAVEPTTLLILSRDALTKMMRKDPGLGLAMMERLATVLAHLVDESYIRKYGKGTGAAGENLAAPNDLF